MTRINNKIPVIVIFAPTATGKTALTLDLFGKSGHFFCNGKAELISADSMQVYKNLNIGTAKPSEQEQKELKTHLIDIHEITEPFNVSEFVEKSDFLCEKIYSEGKIPVIAGGTGFYIKNFLSGLPTTPESDEKIRNNLKKRLSIEGKEKLYHELLEIDSESAKKIHQNDEYRILRALEVFYTTGKTRSSYKLNNQLRDKYDFKIIILERNREELYNRINLRVDLMFKQGLKEEIQNLIKNGAKQEFPGMQAIGYREWFEYQDENLIREKIKRNSRKYAKKQYTFMKEIPNSVIIDLNSCECLNEKVYSIIKDFFMNNFEI